MKQVRVDVLSNTEVMPGVFLLRTEANQIASESTPGQFITISCNGEQGLLMRRPLSIHQADSSGLALLFASTGKGTKWLARSKEGATIDLLGPLGNGFTIRPDSRKLLLVAGGIGIAPLVFLAKRAVTSGLKVHLLHGAPTAPFIYSSHLLPQDLELTVITEDGTAGEKGMVTDLLPEFASQADQIFACGPVSMYRTITKHVQKLSLKNEY